MQLNTRHFGQIEIDEEGIIDFPEGIPGFRDAGKFILLDTEEKDLPFQWLLSVGNPDLAFIVIDPRFLIQDYEVDIEKSDADILDIEDTDRIMVFSIVVIPEDITKMTANLKAPVLINVGKKRGKQVILDKAVYQVKYYILDELRRIGGSR